MNQQVKVGLIQLPCNTSIEKNMQNTLSAIEQSAKQGAQIICLQELFRSLYFCDIEDYERFQLAEAIPDGISCQAFAQLSKKLGVVIIASLFEKRAEGLYHNTAVVFDADGSYLGKYRKQHIPDDPGYYEKFYFTPGDNGYQVFKTKFGVIGVLVCWDQWYPEAARITALKGAQILFYPTAIGWAKSQDEATNKEQYDAWFTTQRAHAIANGVYVVAVNRTGQEGNMQFWGGSFISNPIGKVIYQAPHLNATVHVETLDLKASDYYRTHWPFLRDRRVDTYGSIQQRFIDA